MVDGFDFVVAGGGSAGCVVAARLSEDPGARVLLLEAGPGDNNLFLKMPLAFRLLRMTNLYDWGLKTEPEPWARDRSIPAARGKVLGGSSSVNGMMYSRGHPRDYDQWAQMGATGWAYEEVLPFFRKSESNWRGASHWHGADGPLGVSRPDTDTPLTRALKSAGQAAGLPVTDDFEGEQPEGVGLPDLTTASGKRASASQAFLNPARSRPNLTIITSARVTRLVLDRGRVTHIEYVRNNVPQRVAVGQEAILCGGAYASPHLLMLSGIGRGDDLRRAGVTPVLDLPGVGQNLKEHPLAAMGFQARQPLGFSGKIRADRLALSGLGWMLTGRGFPSTVPLSAIIYHKSQPGLERPDLENIVMPTALDARVWFPGIVSPKPEVLTNLNVVLHPSSTGSVTLRSADPEATPVIRLNILQAQEDIDRLRYNIRWFRDLVRTAPLSEFAGDEIFPGKDIESDAALDAYIRSTVVTAQHPVGTCRMGTDPSVAVVSPELRVHGTENLRVADASVMPSLIGGHTNAPAVMIGERAADFIRAGR